MFVYQQVMDKLKTKDRASSLPLLNCLCADLVNQEMNFFVENVASQAHKKPGLHILAGPYGGSEYGGSQYGGSQDDLAGPSTSYASVKQVSQSQRPTGLFRGKSIMEHPLERYHAAVVRYGTVKII
jgi:hypothetical protein